MVKLSVTPSHFLRCRLVILSRASTVVVAISSSTARSVLVTMRVGKARLWTFPVVHSGQSSLGHILPVAQAS